ncbi:hypothetical protein [Flavobacterium oreochromis]|uniref:Uncharacterized protein n=1 Tax=Flavobacterium columnare TaxID=996 RepID=A0A246GED9_9FLAO|nr:hypothetical protein [Flavobacterium oreochromis]OWP79758.1 hypothetical protein BWK62_00550 [Flavobacterium oreochromis]
MTHQDYINLITKKNALIKEDNLLFWDLWCLNYVFEKIDSEKYAFYKELENSFNTLWKYNNNEISIKVLLDNNNVQSMANFDNDIFEDLDEFDISDKAVQEFITGFESIISNLDENQKVIYNAYENPINLIDVEIEGIKISNDNTNNTYLNEINAQFRLADDLIKNKVDFGYEKRNIYRN